jgi:hypothetical protein
MKFPMPPDAASPLYVSPFTQIILRQYSLGTNISTSLPVYIHEARLLFLSYGGVPMWPDPTRYLVKQKHRGIVSPLLTATSLLGRLCLVLYEIVECRRS